MSEAVKLTEWQMKAARHIASRNREGLGAIMPFGEMIIAADELNKMGLAEDRSGTERRWLTPAGLAALEPSPCT